MSNTDNYDEVLAVSEPWVATDEGGGYTFPDFDWLAYKDPGYNAVRLPFAARSFEPDADGELPVKYREIMVGVLLCYRGHDTPEPHFRRALREGATMKEIIEALQTAVMPTGFPTLHYALRFLKNIDRDIRAGKPI